MSKDGEEVVQSEKASLISKNILAEEKCLPKVAKYFKNILIAFTG